MSNPVTLKDMKRVVQYCKNSGYYKVCIKDCCIYAAKSPSSPRGLLLDAGQAEGAAIALRDRAKA